MDKYINKVIHGDCLEVMKDMPDKCVDLVLTDPPYGIDFLSTWGAKTGNMKDKIESDGAENAIKLLHKTIPELIRVLKDDSEIYWFAGGGNRPAMALTWLALREYEPDLIVSNVLIWDKMSVGMGFDWRFQWESIFQLTKGKGIKSEDFTRSNVLRSKKIIPQAGEHPTPKTIEIMSQLIKAKSKEGDIILDPFLGSGTTAVACKQLHRNFIGVEIGEKYCEIARSRLSQDFLF